MDIAEFEQRAREARLGRSVRTAYRRLHLVQRRTPRLQHPFRLDGAKKALANSDRASPAPGMENCPHFGG